MQRMCLLAETIYPVFQEAAAQGSRKSLAERRPDVSPSSTANQLCVLGQVV